MIYILAAALGLAVGRWLTWWSVLAVSTVLALAVGAEGAIEGRTLTKVLLKGLKVNATFQGTYLVHLLWLDLWQRYSARRDEKARRLRDH